MYFTTGQICILIVITELIIYLFLSKCLDTIAYCSKLRTYRKEISAGLISPNGFKTILKEETKKDENK